MSEVLTAAVAQTRANCNRQLARNLLDGVDQGAWTLTDAWEAIETTHDDHLWNTFCDAVDERDTR